MGDGRRDAKRRSGAGGWGGGGGERFRPGGGAAAAAGTCMHAVGSMGIRMQCSFDTLNSARWPAPLLSCAHLLCPLRMAARRAPNVLVTGTPGTGKTTLCEQVAGATGLKHVNVGDLVKAQQLHTGWDEEFECLVMDEDKVRASLFRACCWRRRMHGGGGWRRVAAAAEAAASPGRGLTSPPLSLLLAGV